MKIHQVIIRGITRIDAQQWEVYDKPQFELTVTANSEYHAVAIKKFVDSGCDFDAKQMAGYLNSLADLRSIVRTLPALHTPIQGSRLEITTEVVAKEVVAKVL